MGARIHLDFSGYWRDVNRGGIPSGAGIFCVYRCRFDGISRTVAPLQLLYVGEAVDARRAVEMASESRDGWEQHLGPGEELCYSYAPIILYRARARAELERQGRAAEGSGSGPAGEGDRVELLLSGRIALLTERRVSAPRPEGGEPGLRRRLGRARGRAAADSA